MRKSYGNPGISPISNYFLPPFEVGNANYVKYILATYDVNKMFILTNVVMTISSSNISDKDIVEIGQIHPTDWRYQLSFIPFPKCKKHIVTLVNLI